MLVETGFISNRSEERLLASDDYQQQIAAAIYGGLRNYFLAHPLQSAPQGGAQMANAGAPADGLFYYRRRALNHFACGDLVRKLWR